MQSARARRARAVAVARCDGPREGEQGRHPHTAQMRERGAFAARAVDVWTTETRVRIHREVVAFVKRPKAQRSATLRAVAPRAGGLRAVTAERSRVVCEAVAAAPVLVGSLPAVGRATKRQQRRHTKHDEQSAAERYSGLMGGGPAHRRCGPPRGMGAGTGGR